MKDASADVEREAETNDQAWHTLSVEVHVVKIGE